MLIRKPLILLTSVLAAALLASGPVAAAGLKDKPPSGVKLSGAWRLDPQRSDDPRVVMERAAKTERQRHDPEPDYDRGGVFDRDCRTDPIGRADPTGRDTIDPLGRDCRDPWSRGGPYAGRRSPFPDDSYRRDRGGPSTTIDPTGGGGSISWGTGGVGGITNEWLLQLDPSPDNLTILDGGTRVSVSENKLETACSAGQTEPVADSFGDGERRCGWSGKAWVIETTRGKRFKRVDRFELAKNGAVLNYTTLASGQNVPPVKIFRTYELVPARAE